MKRAIKIDRLLVLIALASIGSAPACGAGQTAPLGRYDYLPYDVTVSIAFADDAEITEAFRQSVRATLHTRLEQTFGATWVFSTAEGVRLDNRLTPANRSGLDRLSYLAAAAELTGVACDKAFFLTVGRDGTQWQVAGREWDRSLQSLGPTLTETAIERRDMADAALTVIKRLFSPLLIINDAERDSTGAVLTIRAGSLPLGDPKFEPLKPGDILQPVFRFLDSKRAARSIQVVPWTYLVLGPIGKGQIQVRASVVSSYRAPLGANMRRRVEALAVRVRPELPETRLKLVAGRNPAEPQRGLFVSVGEMPPVTGPPKSAPSPQANGQAAKAETAKPPAAPEPPLLRLLSDRQGEVTIPVDPKHPILRIDVHSGGAILARRPFVPGLEAKVTLQIADDHVRLGCEREIDILESQLIETVARRGALLARARLQLNHTDDRAAEHTLAEVERLPKADDYFRQINQIRVLAIEEAQKRKDRVGERRIEDLCQKTLDRITQYLPDDRITVFKDELARLVERKKAKIQEDNAPMRRDITVAAPPAAAQKEAPLRRSGSKQPAPAAKQTEKKNVTPRPAGI